MPKDTTDIIEQAITDAGMDVETGEVVDTDEDTDAEPDAVDDDPEEVDSEGSDKVEDADADADAGSDADSKTSDDKEPAKEVAKPDKKDAVDTRSDKDKALDKELEALGLKPPKDGRDNRIPHKRVRKMVGSAIERTEARFTEQIKAKDTQIASAKERLGYMDAVDRMIVEKPEQYIQNLAKLYPHLYGKYLTGGGTATNADKKSKADADDSMPGPDVRYDDGSFGYSPEGLERRDAWNRRQAVKEAMEKIDQRLKPLDDERKAKENYQERAKRVQNVVEEQRSIWGDEFTKDEALGEKSLILTAWKKEVADAKAEGRRARTFAAVVKSVLTPNADKIRNQLLDEQNKVAAERKAASTARPGTGKSKVVEDEDEDPVTKAIANAVREAGLE